MTSLSEEKRNPRLFSSLSKQQEEKDSSKAGNQEEPAEPWMNV